MIQAISAGSDAAHSLEWALVGAGVMPSEAPDFCL